MSLSEQERGFLAHIAADPFDDTLRLIYADWLEERGDPRADLIRLSLEYDRINEGWFGYAEQPHATDLDERVTELIDVHWRTWQGCVPPGFYVWLNGGLLEVNVRRGVDLLPGVTGDSPSIQRWWQQYRPWIMRLKLSECDDTTLNALVKQGFLDGIPELELRGDTLSRNGLISLSNVTSLRLLRMRGKFLGKALERLRSMERLRGLSLGATTLSEHGINHLAEMPNLRSLQLDHTEFRGGTTRALQRLTRLETLKCNLARLPDQSTAFLEGMVSLRRLHLQPLNPRFDSLHSLTALPNLEELKLVVPESPELVFPILGQLTGLRQLRIWGRRGTLGEAAQHLRHLQHLESLDLADTSATPEAAQHIGSLPSLRHLRIGRADPDAVPCSLIGLTKAKCLESLDLTDIDATTLAQLADLPHLRRLVVRSKSLAEDELARLPILSQLTDLELGLSGEGTGLAALLRQPRLVRLALKGSNLDLAHIVGLRALRWLTIQYTKFSGTNLIHLRGFTALRRLRIEESPVRTEDFQHLVHLPNLGELSFHGSPITDDALPLLAACPRLMHLDLIRTQITDAAFGHLARLPHLRFVCISPRMSWHSYITEAGVSSLQAARPDVVVHFVG